MLWTGSTAAPPGPSCLPGPLPEEVSARLRDLADGLGLPTPAAVEVSPLSLGEAGVSFGPVVRLAPAPTPALTGTLMHEFGHTGPVRERIVEEAIADLTRRALLASALSRSPAQDSLLAPLLATIPAPAESEAATPSSSPLDAATYHHAAALAVRLWQAAGGAEAPLDAASQALTLARAARLGRHLSSAEALALPRRTGEAALFAARHALPLLRLAAEAAGQRAGLIQQVVKALSTSPKATDWRPYARIAAAGDDTDRRVAHEVLSHVAPGSLGEDLLLDEWVEQAGMKNDLESLSEARLRRGQRRLAQGQRAGGRDDLLAVLLHSRSASRVVDTVAALQQAGIVDAPGAARLLDLSDALQGCGAEGAALRGLALASGGHPQEAVAWFERAASPADTFGLAVAHAEALAASAGGEAAARLMRQQDQAWQRQGRPRPWSAAAAMAAVFFDAETPARDIARAARRIRAVGGADDRLLAEAAQRHKAEGRERKARRDWRRLLAHQPGSDLAAAARAALMTPGDG